MAKTLRGGLTPSDADGSVAVTPLECGYAPKNSLQRQLRSVLPDASVIILNGEQGTGKTGGAIGEGLLALLRPDSGIRKLMVTRPSVSRGSRLGFMPGDLLEKMAPWLASVNDAMEGFSNATIAKLGGRVEVISLEHIQGRTVRNAWLVVDEAENLWDRAEIIDVVTRVGPGGKVFLAGNPPQSRLPHAPNPFGEFIVDHQRTPGVAVITATRDDQLRSPGFLKTFLEIEEKIQRRRSSRR